MVSSTTFHPSSSFYFYKILPSFPEKETQKSSHSLLHSFHPPHCLTTIIFFTEALPEQPWEHRLPLDLSKPLQQRALKYIPVNTENLHFPCCSSTVEYLLKKLWSLVTLSSSLGWSSLSYRFNHSLHLLSTNTPAPSSIVASEVMFWDLRLQICLVQLEPSTPKQLSSGWTHQLAVVHCCATTRPIELCVLNRSPPFRSSRNLSRSTPNRFCP